MAFTFTSRTSDPGATTGQDKTSASFTPTANSLLVVCASAQRENHATAQAWTITDSAGLTWTARGVTTNITGNFGGGLACWTAPVGASPAAMTVTADPWSTSVTGWVALEVFDVTGHDVASPVAQTPATATTTSTGNAVSLTVTLGTNPSSSNAVVGIFTGQNDATGAFTSPAGFTQITNPTGGFNHIGAWWTTGTTTPGITCSDLGQSVNWGAAIALEIASDGAGAPDPVPRGALVAPSMATMRSAVW